MNWLPVMDSYLALTVAIGLIAVIVFLYLPAMAFLSWYEKNTDRANRPRLRSTKAGCWFHFVVTLLVLVGLVHGTYAPNTWLGAWVKSIGGWGGWIFLELAVSCLAGVGLHLLGIELYYIHYPIWDGPDPVKAWIPIEEGKGLNTGLAYAIEFRNDEITKMAFVFSIFRNCFNMEPEPAYQEVMAIHKLGSGIVGSMSRENAEALLQHIQAEAAKRGFPLQCKIVPAFWDLDEQ